MKRSGQNPVRRPGIGGALGRQMRHSLGVTLLLGCSLCGVAALDAYVRNSSRFQNRSMQLIMKGTGHNLWFLPASANLLDGLSGAPGGPMFADDRVDGLAADRQVASTYWANLLQERVVVKDREVLLTGVTVVDDHQVTEEKDHILVPLPPGEADLGFTLARDWNLAPGDRLAVGAREYRIRSVYPPNGTLDDARLWVPLDEAQAWLGKPGVANLILGFLCMHRSPRVAVSVALLEQRLADRHPDVRVIPLMNLLNARALARLTTSRYLRRLLHVVLGLTVLLVGAVAWMEVHARRSELAMLMAMGASRCFVLSFFLAKLAIVGLVAAAAGFLIGSWASVHWLAPVLVTHTQPMAVVWADMPGLLARVLGVVALAAAAPLVRLARMDPTRILAEE